VAGTKQTWTGPGEDPRRLRELRTTRALLAGFKDHLYEALVTLTLATGLRQGEVLGLAWGDIDLDAGTLSVRHQLQRIDGEYHLSDLKTRLRRRTLSLPHVAVDALRQHRAAQNAERLRVGPAREESGRVFTTATGGYLNGSTVTRGFQKQLAKAGLRRLKFHHLRHGAASLLLAQRAPMRVVMELPRPQPNKSDDEYLRSHRAPAYARRRGQSQCRSRRA
jgi:integrase